MRNFLIQTKNTFEVVFIPFRGVLGIRKFNFLQFGGRNRYENQSAHIDDTMDQPKPTPIVLQVHFFSTTKVASPGNAWHEQARWLPQSSNAAAQQPKYKESKSTPN